MSTKQLNNHDDVSKNQDKIALSDTCTRILIMDAVKVLSGL